MTQPLRSHAKPAEWIAYALCAEVGADLCFPEKGESVNPAKTICARCPVTAECLDYALAHDERFGVWGGLSFEERREMKKDGGAA